MARVAQGAAGALMVPQVLSLIQLRLAGAGRARAIGLYSMVLALGVSLGQLVGGLIVTVDPGGAGWRAAFLVNGPVGVVLYVVARRGLRTGSTEGRRPALDLGGVALLSTAMIAVVLPLVFGPEDNWPLWTVGSLVVGLAGLVVFVGYERRLAGRGGAPLLDLRAVTPAGVKAALAACVLIMGAYFGFVLVLTLDLQVDRGLRPLVTALAFVPYSTGFATVSLTWTRLSAAGRRHLSAAGPVAFAIGVAGVGLLPGSGWPVLVASPLLLLAGAGHAATYSPLVGWVVERVGPGYASAVSALTTTAPPLAAVVTYAGIGGLYLTAPPGHRAGPRRSGPRRGAGDLPGVRALRDEPAVAGSGLVLAAARTAGRVAAGAGLGVPLRHRSGRRAPDRAESATSPTGSRDGGPIRRRGGRWVRSDAGRRSDPDRWGTPPHVSLGGAHLPLTRRGPARRDSAMTTGLGGNPSTGTRMVTDWAARAWSIGSGRPTTAARSG